jgi:AmpD protein
MTTPINEEGWHTQARIVPSPNFNDRPPGATLDLIVVHNISLPPGEYGTGAVDALFCNSLDCSAHPFYAGLEGLQVSSHFLIDRTGALTQFVSCRDRAWHAGRSAWAGRQECNDYSVGIELEGTDRQPYEAAQYAALAGLIRDLRTRYAALARGAIAGHSDIAPGRKTDPGPAFEWGRLRRLLRDPAEEHQPGATTA